MTEKKTTNTESATMKITEGDIFIKYKNDVIAVSTIAVVMIKYTLSFKNCLIVINDITHSSFSFD